MTPISAVILAHRDPAQLKRLVNALDDIPIILHCDAGTPPSVAAEMVADLPTRVRLCQPVRASLASWSLVEAELRALRLALDFTSARHIAVLSGSDYPLVTVQVLIDELAAWAGQSYLWNVPIPYWNWNTPRKSDGGLWRFRHRFVTHKSQVVYWRSIPLHWPFRRSVPDGLELRASSQWKIYSREHAEILLRVVDSRQDLMRFWRSTFVPDESFAASILASPSIVGSAAIAACYAHAWYIDWPTPHSYHPRSLTDQDFPALVQARNAPSATPETAGFPPDNADLHLALRKLFARKFAPEAGGAVLDQIDSNLRVPLR